MALLVGTLWGCPAAAPSWAVHPLWAPCDTRLEGDCFSACGWGLSREIILKPLWMHLRFFQPSHKRDFEVSEMREKTAGAGQAARTSILPGSVTQAECRDIPSSPLVPRDLCDDKQHMRGT